MYRSLIMLFSFYHVSVWTGEGVAPVFLFVFSLIFDVRAMFGPLVASHFICDFLAFEPGTVLPDVNADCFPFPM